MLDKPGKLKNGVSSLGTESHLNIEILTTGEIKCYGPLMEAIRNRCVAGRSIDLGGLPITPKAHLALRFLGGKLRGLAVTSSKRHPDSLKSLHC